MHCRYDSSRTSHMHTDTLHTWGYALDRYENWPQHWLWIVMPASASMVTPKEQEETKYGQKIFIGAILSP